MILLGFGTCSLGATAAAAGLEGQRSAGTKRRKRPAPHGMIALLSALAMVALLPAVSSSAMAAGELTRGKALLRRDCARCHAIGRSDQSPDIHAPPLRTLARRYPIDSLQEALAEGILTGHPKMPEFSFDPDDVDAIIVYLKSIQQR